jgi:hypothetical protein
MVPWLVLGSVLLLPSAAFLLWSWRSSRNEMALMRATETTRAADVAKLPAGSVVEVKGKLRCTDPLTAELSKTLCAHFDASVERDYEILEYDAKRKTSQRVRKTQLLQWNRVSAPFEIEDETGRTLVRPDNAIIESITAIDRYEVKEEGADDVQSPTAVDDHRTLGFRYKEMHLPLDVDIYVLGIAGEDHSIGAPPTEDKEQRFIISINSEEARAADLGRHSRWVLGLGVSCLVGAVTCLGLAFWLARPGLVASAPPQEILQSESVW